MQLKIVSIFLFGISLLNLSAQNTAIIAGLKGNAAAENQQYQTAIQLFSTALQSYPAHSKLLYGRAKAYTAIGKLAEAEADYQQINKQAPNASSDFNKRVMQSEKLLNNQNFAEAIEMLQKLVNYAPSNSLAHYQLSKAYLQGSNYTLAAKSLEQACKLSNNSQYHIALVALYGNMKQPKKAYKTADKYLAHNPFEQGMYIIASKVAYNYSNFKVMYTYTSVLIKALPHNKDIQYQTALMCFGTKDYWASLKQCNKLITSEPLNVNYRQLRGKTLLATRNWRRAETDFAMLLDADPRNSEAFLNKGKARLQQQKLEGACTDWKLAKRYGNPEAIGLLEKHCKQIN